MLQLRDQSNCCAPSRETHKMAEKIRTNLKQRYLKKSRRERPDLHGAALENYMYKRLGGGHWDRGKELLREKTSEIYAAHVSSRERVNRLVGSLDAQFDSSERLIQDSDLINYCSFDGYREF